MTLKHQQGLWLWAGTLLLTLLVIVPLTAWVRVIVALAIVCAVVLAWVRLGNLATGQQPSLIFAAGQVLPSTTYRQPVVLVCGDAAGRLFATVATDQLALRVTEYGCYVRVSSLEQLPAVAAELLTIRPQWCAQLSVMFIVNPGAHTDSAVLAGQLSALCNQLVLVRKRGTALPLLLLSYLQASRGAGPWFSWEAQQNSLTVREGGACMSLAEWQRYSTDGAIRSARLHTSVQLNSAAAWLSETVLPHFNSHAARHPVGPALVCAITLVPVLPHWIAGNVWQQWLGDKVALVEANQSPAVVDSSLPFPDPLLQLLATHDRHSPTRRATVLAVWLWAVASSVALASSAWQNTLLARQVSDDLRRYLSIAFPARPDQPEFALRQAAVKLLQLDAVRLDNYYRFGEPLALGLGLYHGERLRAPLLEAIASHRQPEPVVIPAHLPRAVRLNSLSLFATGSAQLKRDSTKVLINALVDLKAQPGWLIVIAGHTDATGNSASNLQLSKARAAAVRDWMQRMGDIPDSCFAVQGFGASQPIASNENESGRTVNRRVDIRLVPEVGACMLSTTEPDPQPPVANRGI